MYRRNSYLAETKAVFKLNGKKKLRAITHGLLQPCRHQSICKICPFGKDNYFSLQMPRNSYLYCNISAENGSKTAEANRENVMCQWLTRTEKLNFENNVHVLLLYISNSVATITQSNYFVSY